MSTITYCICDICGKKEDNTPEVNRPNSIYGFTSVRIIINLSDVVCHSDRLYHICWECRESKRSTAELLNIITIKENANEQKW